MPPSEKRTSENSNSSPIYYRYADGASNVYRLDRSEEIRFSYSPVKPENSSSGVYDGGEPVDKIIDEARFDELAKLIDSLLDAYAGKPMNREMGTGMFSSNAGKENRRAIVSRRNPKKLEIESLFKALREE